MWELSIQVLKKIFFSTVGMSVLSFSPRKFPRMYLLIKGRTHEGSKIAISCTVKVAINS